jgi:hypothetical protein
LPRLSFLFWLNLSIAKNLASTVITPIGEALKKEHPEKKEYWQNELKSLCIEPDTHRMSLMTKRRIFRHWQNAIGRKPATDRETISPK